MKDWIDRGRRGYLASVWGLSYLQDLFLLVVRVYWGSMLVRSGWNKFADLEGTAKFFESLGIFWPKANAVLSGATELGCGVLLVVGLAARIAAVPLVFNMLVAFATNSGDRFRGLFASPNDFVTAPEFLYLLACLLVLLFGAGMISLDGLLGFFLGRLPAEGGAARAALSANAAEPMTRGRREFAKLMVAAVAGLTAGVLIRRGASPPVGIGERKDKTDSAKPGPSDTAAEGASSSASGKEAKAPSGTDPDLMLAGGKHVCRGLNTCKGKGKDHKNSCAGQGACATFASHACNGLNDCKGQGGCDGTAGINRCSGKGACAVPLKDETWKLARARFERLAKAKDLKIGTAPAKS
ncbi:MAG TPA: DoxX family protein [Pirellulales bacterium]|jgi:uncharacterized membrane protein YphA (DoxX/SURF4 family)|nr:DoxX family protein [Pirellulales bacterium]